MAGHAWRKQQTAQDRSFAVAAPREERTPSSSQVLYHTRLSFVNTSCQESGKGADVAQLMEYPFGVHEALAFIPSKA